MKDKKRKWKKASSFFLFAVSIPCIGQTLAYGYKVFTDQDSDALGEARLLGFSVLIIIMMVGGWILGEE